MTATTVHADVYRRAADHITRHGLHRDDFWPGFPAQPAHGQPCCAVAAINLSGGIFWHEATFADWLIRAGRTARCCGCGTECPDDTCIDVVETIAGWSDRHTAVQVAEAFRACASEVTP